MQFLAESLFLRGCDTICTLYDAIYQLQKESQKPYLSSNSLNVIELALKKINSDFCNNNITVESLAKLCGISAVYFRKIFNSVLGVSPKEYIIQKRIEYAKNLLESQQFSVLEVAMICGYAEQCHFCREFTKRTGISPTKYFKN